jgi:soluble lytic murein transglycosylase
MLRQVSFRLTLVLGLLVIFFSCENKYNTTFVTNVDEYKIEKMPASLQVEYWVSKYSKEYNVPQEMMYAVLYNETRYLGPNHYDYRPDRMSNKGAIGPFQLMPRIAAWCCEQTGEKYDRASVKTDVRLNTRLAAYFMRHLLDRYDGDVAKVAGAYHTGKPRTGYWYSNYIKKCVKNPTMYKKNWV